MGSEIFGAFWFIRVVDVWICCDVEVGLITFPCVLDLVLLVSVCALGRTCFVV